MYILSNQGERVVFKFGPYENAVAINAIEDDLQGTGTVEKYFSYSYDQSIYSDWTLIEETTLADFVIDSSRPFSLKLRYVLTSGEVTVSQATIGITKAANANNSDNTAPFLATSTQANFSNPFGIQINPDPKLKIYQQNKAIDLQGRLSESTFQMFGHDVWYYRALPRKYGTDAFLHEHSKLYTDVRKCFPIMFEDNDFKQQNPTYDPFGVQFADQLPFEVDVNKAIFERIYGKGQMPQRGDVVFIPILKMIYEVQSSFLFREFMNTGVFYKVALKKYQPSSHREEEVNIIDDIEDTLDVDVPQAEEIFNEEWQEDAEKIIDEQQTSLKTVDQDPTRLVLDQEVRIANDDQIRAYSNIISDTYYDLSSVHNPQINGERVIAQYEGEFNTVENKSYTTTAWVKVTDVSGKVGRITSFAPSAGNSYTISMNRNFLVLGIDNGNEVQITNTSNGTVFVGTISGITSSTAILTITEDMKAALTAQNPNWSAGTKDLRKASNSAIIKANNFAIELVTRGLLRLKIGSTERLISITEVGENWVGIAVAFSREFNQLSVSTWKPGIVEADGGVINIDKNIIENFTVPEIDGSNLYLPSSFTKITNIRVFNDYVDFDNLDEVMSRYVVDNAHHSVVVDNAIPQVNQTFTGTNYM